MSRHNKSMKLALNLVWRGRSGAKAA